MIKNLSWTLIGNSFYSLVKWIILVLFLNVLSTSEVGEYTLALAFTAPFFLFANMRLRTIYVVNDNNNFRELMALRILIIIISTLIIGILSYLIFPEYFYVFVIVSLIKVVELFSDLFYALPHKFDRLDIIGKVLFVKGLVILTVVSISVVVFDSILTILIFYLISMILYLLIEYKICSRYYIKNNFQFSFITITLVSALPLGFVQFLSSVNVSHPKYFIEIFHNVELVGIFTSITYILVIVNLIMNSISQSYIVSIKNLIKSNNYVRLKNLLYKKLGFICIIMGLFGLILSSLLGDIFLETIYGEIVAEYSYILIILSFAIPFTFYSWMSDTVLMALESYRIQPIIAIMVLIISVPTTIFFIIHYEMLGATISLLFIYILQAIMKLLFTAQFINRREKKL